MNAKRKATSQNGRVDKFNVSTPRPVEPDPPRERPWKPALLELARQTATLPTVLLDEWWLRATAREWAGQDADEANAMALEDLRERLQR